MANLNLQILERALQRSGLEIEHILKAFSKCPYWLDGSWKPTVNQLRDFANKAHVSVSELLRMKLLAMHSKLSIFVLSIML